MNKRINLNDPDAWSEFDWSEAVVPEALKRTDAQIAMARPSRIRKETGEAKKNALKAAKTRAKDPNALKKQADIGRKTMTTSSSFLKRKEEVREASKKSVVTPFGEFDCYNNAQRSIPCNLAGKLKALPHLYYYKDCGPGEVTYEDVYVTPFGCSNKRADVYSLCKDNKEPNALRLLHKANWWLKMSSTYPNEYYIENRPAYEWALNGLLRNKTKKNLARLKNDK
jgi:hypothetical protein